MNTLRIRLTNLRGSCVPQPLLDEVSELEGEVAALREEVEAWRRGAAAVGILGTADPFYSLTNLVSGLEAHHQEHHASEAALQGEKELLIAEIESQHDTATRFADRYREESDRCDRLRAHVGALMKYVQHKAACQSPHEPCHEHFCGLDALLNSPDLAALAAWAQAREAAVRRILERAEMEFDKAQGEPAAQSWYFVMSDAQAALDAARGKSNG